MKNVAASAVKSADGSHYIVNGEKKWITNGGNADYFTVSIYTTKIHRAKADDGRLSFAPEAQAFRDCLSS